jgi:hypothetical protein
VVSRLAWTLSNVLFRPIANTEQRAALTAMMALRPAFLAKALLGAYVFAALALVLLGTDALDALLFALLLGVPWIILPAGIAAMFVVASDQPIRSWGGLSIEAVVVGSSVWVGVELARHPDAQNGIAFALLPPIQIGAVLVGFFAVLLFELVVDRVRRVKR